MSTFAPPPLTGVRVLELAGLAPGPFAGLLLADYGATVIRVDRPSPNAHSDNPSSPRPSPTLDNLVRHKRSIALSLKSPGGVALLKSLIPHVDVLIDPFRPGVLERLGLSPEDVLLKLNPRLIVGRMTGFRRDGKYKDMAGHDINYLAVSGVLSMLGRKGEAPYPPGNILGDFAGGGHVLFTGILMALLQRAKSGRGQVVEANMVDGAAYLGTFLRLATKTPAWSAPRGENQLDGGAPYYDVYATKDGKWMSVGALEPQFFAELLKGLEIPESSLPGDGNRFNKKNWAAIRALFATKFLSKTRQEWEKVFDGTDACVAPIVEQGELEKQGFQQRPLVNLRESPGMAASSKSDLEHARGQQPEMGQGSGVKGDGWYPTQLRPGEGGEEVVKDWTGWKRGIDFHVEDGDGALAWIEPQKSKL